MPLYSLGMPALQEPSTSSIANPLNSNALIAGTTKLIAPTNANRKQLTIFNNNTAIVYFGYVEATNATNYSFKLAQDGYFELPVPIYTGNLYAFCASANTLSVIEFV